MSLKKEIFDNNIIELDSFLKFLTNLRKNKNKDSNFLNSDQANILNSCIIIIEQLLKRLYDYNNLDEWDKFNNQYKEYFNDKLKNIVSIIDGINFSLDKNKRFVLNDISYLNKIIQLYDESLICIYDNFKYGLSNYILFGKNGAGKTSLLNKLSEDLLSNNSYVARATRNIKYNDNACYFPKHETLVNALEKDDDNTIFILGKCVMKKELNERRLNIDEDNIITNKIAITFESLGLERKVKFNYDGEILLYNNDSKIYSLSKASDGEKTILYFIILTLLVPTNSYIFIDEPENHLNISLMRKLFDILEKERTDVKFIYATNNISFIENRKNAQLIYLEKSSDFGKWEFKKIGDFNEIPLDLILNIEGTLDDIVFCEGENNESYDVKLYSALFPDKQFISSNGCEKVITQTILFNQYKRELKKNTFGIVDFDFRDDKDIRYLKDKNIYVLSVNEIENVFLLNICLTEIILYIKSKKTLEDIKLLIIEEIKKKEKEIKKDYAVKTLRKLHMQNRIENIDCITDELNRINKHNNVEFMKKYNAFVLAFDECMNKNDYNTLMKYVPGKMIIKDAAKIIGISLDNYINLLLNLISQKKEFRDSIVKAIALFDIN